MPIFRTVIDRPEDRMATGIIVPPEVVESLGKGKRPPVRVTINGYSYRSTIAVMGGRFMLPLSKENRIPAGVDAGDEVDIDIVLDTEPRTVEVPEDFAAALETNGLRETFDRLAFTHRKEHVRAIEDATTPETRTRRIDKAIVMLKG